MTDNTIRTLILPNREHPYGDCLQESLAQQGVVPLKCDAGWGFELHKNLALIRRLNPDILHLQWPESLCRGQEADDLEELEKRIAEAHFEIREMNIPIVWTVHNLKPHIIFNPGFQARLYQRFADSADGVIHHSRCGMRTVLKSYNFRESTKHAMIRHGYFTKDTECDLSRGAAREKIVLPPEKHIYLYCGAFRRDKNIDILTCAFGEAGADPSHMLVMVGDDREAAAALYPDCNVDSPNILWPGRLSFQELSIYARAADALISAHGDKHLTSAGPHLSQTYLKPLICPSSDYNHEVLGENGFYFEGGTKAPENLRCLLDGITPEILQSTAGSIERQRVEYQWSEIGKKTKVLYEELLHGD